MQSILIYIQSMAPTHLAHTEAYCVTRSHRPSALKKQFLTASQRGNVATNTGLKTPTVLRDMVVKMKHVQHSRFKKLPVSPTHFQRKLHLL